MSSDITSSHSISQLELPTPERLLPVGPQREFSSLVERVRQVLDISDIEGLCISCKIFLEISKNTIFVFLKKNEKMKKSAKDTCSLKTKLHNFQI